MQATRTPSRWRVGAKAALYFIAFVILAGGLLIAVGILLFLFLGLIFAAGIITALAFFWFVVYFFGEERRDRLGH